MYIKKFGEFFFHAYSLTCLNKDTSGLLKVINNLNDKLPIQTIVLAFLKKCYVYAHNPFNKV